MNVDDDRRRFALDFSGRLRMLVENRGMTLARIARKAGVKPSILYSYANHGTIPNAYTVVKLSKALGVSTDVLLGTWEVDE